MTHKPTPPLSRRNWMFPSEAKECLNVARETVADWDKKEILNATRTLGGHRRYDKKEIEQLAIVVHANRIRGHKILYRDPDLP